MRNAKDRFPDLRLLWIFVKSCFLKRAIFQGLAVSFARSTNPASVFSPVSCLVSFSFPSAILLARPLPQAVLTRHARGGALIHGINAPGSLNFRYGRPWATCIARHVNHYLAFGIQFYFGPIHRPRRRPFEVNRASLS